jgi:hypothetical protein
VAAPGPPGGLQGDRPAPPGAPAEARGGGVVRASDLVAGGGGDGRNPLDRFLGAGPSPEFAAGVAEEYRRRLDTLKDPALRVIAERKLAGFTNEEIARELGVSLRTVTLKLELIRKRWKGDEETP